MSGLKRVLAATDGSEHGATVVTGAGIAPRAGARLDVLSVVGTPLVPGIYVFGAAEIEVQDSWLEEARAAAQAQAQRAELAAIDLSRQPPSVVSLHLLRHGTTATLVVPDERRRGLAMGREARDAA